MTRPVLTRILVLLWAAVLALLSLIMLGHTHLVSLLAGKAHVTLGADIALLFLTVVFMLLLRPVANRIRSPWLYAAALLPPCLVLWGLLF